MCCRIIDSEWIRDLRDLSVEQWKELALPFALKWTLVCKRKWKKKQRQARKVEKEAKASKQASNQCGAMESGKGSKRQHARVPSTLAISSTSPTDAFRLHFKANTLPTCGVLERGGKGIVWEACKSNASKQRQDPRPPSDAWHCMRCDAYSPTYRRMKCKIGIRFQPLAFTKLRVLHTTWMGCPLSTRPIRLLASSGLTSTFKGLPNREVASIFFEKSKTWHVAMHVTDENKC